MYSFLNYFSKQSDNPEQEYLFTDGGPVVLKTTTLEKLHSELDGLVPFGFAVAPDLPLFATPDAVDYVNDQIGFH